MSHSTRKDGPGWRSTSTTCSWDFDSDQGMLPNPHSRSCTAKLKLYPSHQLLA